MAKTESARGVTQHFIARAVERIGCTERQARGLGRYLLWAVKNERFDKVEYIARLNREGLRLYRFRWPPTKGVFYVAVNTKHGRCVTVLPPGFRLTRQGKASLYLLGEDDL